MKVSVVILALLLVGIVGNAQVLTSSSFGYLSIYNSPAQPQRESNQCAQGAYWTGQSCMPCQQVQDGYCQCSNYLGCDNLICNNGTVSNGDTSNPRCVGNDTCYISGLGCKTCGIGSDAFICKECQSGYQLIGGICQYLGQCQQFNESNALCTQCRSSYYFNLDASSLQDRCSRCMTNCQECDSANTCNQCITGYQWSIDQYGEAGCQSCQINFCRNCDGNITNCQECSSSYYLIPATNNTRAICNACSSNCQQCNSTKCLQCSTGYYLQNGQCQPCSQNCQECTNSTQCTSCNSPYILQNGACQPCPQNCQTCSNSTTCTQCSNGFILNPKNFAQCLACPTNCMQCGINNQSQATCSSCSDTYYLQSASQCQLCSSSNPSYYRCNGPLEVTGQSGVIPTQCQDGYFLVKYNNQTQCVQQAVPNKCLTIQNNTNSVCQSCLPNSGYQQLINGQCASCSSISGCSNCNVNGTVLQCSQCYSGYHLSNNKCTQCTQSQGCMTCNNTISCLACQQGYYLNNGQCSPCSNGCTACTNNTNCASCTQGRWLQIYPNATAECMLCPSDCESCVSPGLSCSSCPQGYIQQGMGCISATQQSCGLTVNGTCSLCNYGFYLKNGICYDCVNQYAGFVCRNNDEALSNGTTPSSEPTSYGKQIATFILFIAVIIQNLLY